MLRNYYGQTLKGMFIILFLIGAGGRYSFLKAQTTYNIYFGDNHAHSWYSDGNVDQNQSTYTTPVARSITWARTNRSSMDFLGISDHNHNESLNMTMAYWRSGVREADSVNQDGNFVGLFGQEWGTISGGGHVLVYGTDKLFGWNPGLYDVYVAKGDYGALFTAVRANNGYCYLAHPKSSDYDGIFTGTYNANWDSVIQGVAMKSGNAYSTNTTETDPDAGDYLTQYHDLLKKGYHVAPIANQDNHNTTFGKSNQQRTAVLAPLLTKVNVDNAFRNRRVYATEDHNLQIQFEVGAHRMGELFSMAGSIPIRVKVIDPDGGESISRVEIRYGIPGSGTAPTTLQYVTNRDSLVFTQTQTIGTTYYYYAYVVEADGHRAWTAPMWITATAGSTPGAFALLSPSNGAANQAVSGTLSWQSSANATSYDVYLGTTNPPVVKVSADQAGITYNYSGLTNGTAYFWKVVAKNGGITTDATASPWSFTTIFSPPGVFNLLTPTNGSSSAALSGTLAWQTSTSATGYDVYLSATNPPTTKVSSNQTGTTYNYSGLPYSTVYYWKVVARNSVDTMIAAGSPSNFTTMIAPPSSFNLLSPPSGSGNQPITGTLSWQTSTNAVGYDVYLSTTSPPATKVSSNQATTSYNYNGLSNNTMYYWKVVARNTTDTTIATGSPSNFATIIGPPGTFNLMTPVDSSVNIPVDGILSWRASDKATSYDVYLDLNNPPVTKVSLDQTDTIYNYNGLTNNTDYFWKVVAKNLNGSIEAAGIPCKFRTIIPLPDDFLLLSPADGSLNQPLSGTVEWNASLDAASYDIYLDVNNPPLNRIDSNLTSTSFHYLNLEGGTTYHWMVISKNISGNVVASNSPWAFATINVPVAPSNLLPVAVSETTARFNWTDNAVNELGYRVYRSSFPDGPFVKVDGDLPPDAVTFSDAGLSVNHCYYYRVVPFNDIGEGAFAPIVLTTLASIPGVPSLINGTSHSFTCIIDPGNNPSRTQFAVELKVNGSTNFARKDGILSGTSVWGTFDEWGGSNGFEVNDLQSCALYDVSVLARNLDSILTEPGSPSGVQLLCNVVSQSVTPGWNLISLPVHPDNHEKSSIFPSSVSAAFSYEGSYVQSDTLKEGMGYWVKFNNPELLHVYGELNFADTMEIRAGWNLIGSLSAPVDISSIIVEPVGNIKSNYYAYNGVYVRSDSLLPMCGYWVKADFAGKLIVAASAAIAKQSSGSSDEDIDEIADSFTFEDVSGNQQTLYLFDSDSKRIKELTFASPPLPPAGAFDVRFNSQSYAEYIDCDKPTQSFPINLRSNGQLVTMRWNIKTTGLDVFLSQGNSVKALPANGSISIACNDQKLAIVLKQSSSRQIPQEFSLSQNYPNPFNPTTTISYSLPTKSSIKLTIYNTLGTVISTVVEGVQESGVYQIVWEAPAASGVYYCRLDAIDDSNPQTIFHSIKKMILMK